MKDQLAEGLISELQIISSRVVPTSTKRVDEPKLTNSGQKRKREGEEMGDPDNLDHAPGSSNSGKQVQLRHCNLRRASRYEG